MKLALVRSPQWNPLDSILRSFNLHEWVDRIVCVSSFYFGVGPGTRHRVSIAQPVSKQVFGQVIDRCLHCTHTTMRTNCHTLPLRRLLDVLELCYFVFSRKENKDFFGTTEVGFPTKKIASDWNWKLVPVVFISRTTEFVLFGFSCRRNIACLPSGLPSESQRATWSNSEPCCRVKTERRCGQHSVVCSSHWTTR